jgi:hypothetical protein
LNVTPNQLPPQLPLVSEKCIRSSRAPTGQCGYDLDVLTLREARGEGVEETNGAVDVPLKEKFAPT